MTRAAAALALALSTAGILAGPASAGSGVPASQSLVSLLNAHTARTAPSAKAHRIETVPALRPLTGVRTVLPVLARRTTRGVRWLRVALPGRPNGHRGWILAERTKPSTTAWHLRLKLSTRLVTAYEDGLAERSFRAVIGAPSTPTPTGHFFIEEAVALTTADPGGPFALATSARSNVLQEFEGGPGQVAIHGIYNLSSDFGSAASHGCVRISTDAITWLAQRIGAGVPLTIVS